MAMATYIQPRMIPHEWEDFENQFPRRNGTFTAVQKNTRPSDQLITTVPQDKEKDLRHSSRQAHKHSGCCATPAKLYGALLESGQN
jgi:hypothetical protein